MVDPPPRTIAARIAATGGRTSGFDYLRIGLAVSIVLWHSISTSYGSAFELVIWRGPLGLVMHFVLPMFFALSGFLVAGSLDRCASLISFFALRALRIVPALAVEITLSALLFGPMLSRLPVAAYFAAPEFRAYFLNIVGDIHYLLPGVFAANPLPHTVNAQLWTVPFELQCYAALGALAVVGLVRRRRWLLAFTLLAQALWIAQALKLGDDGSSNGASGPVLVISFLVGLLFHLYRDRIVLARRWFWLSLVGGLALSALPHGAYYLPLPACYLTVWLGLCDPPKRRFIFRGDYSYGLYLFGFPIQQVVASFGPALHHWYLNAAIAVPVGLSVAALSWHLIEKPALAQRRRIPALERRLLALRPQALLPEGLGALASGAAIVASGVMGVLALVDAHERLGLLAILACLVLAALPLRPALAAALVQSSGRGGRLTGSFKDRG